MAANAAKFWLHKTDSISLTCSELIHAFTLVYLAIVKCLCRAIHIQTGRLWGSLQPLSVLATDQICTFLCWFITILLYASSEISKLLLFDKQYATWTRTVSIRIKKASHGQLNIIFHQPPANLDDREYNKVKTAKWPSQDMSLAPSVFCF